MTRLLNDQVFVFIVQHLGELSNNSVMRGGCGNNEAFTSSDAVGCVSLSNFPLT